jgi:hypothetical protein
MTREATAEAGTLYVPAARAACTAATLSVRTSSPEAVCETSLAALEKVAWSLSKLLPAADVLPLPCDTDGAVGFTPKSDLNPSMLLRISIDDSLMDLSSEPSNHSSH